MCIYTFYVHIVAKYIRLHLDAELILPVRRIVLDSAQPVQLLISVTQLVEHLPRKQYVVGSNPTSAALFSLKRKLLGLGVLPFRD